MKCTRFRLVVLFAIVLLILVYWNIFRNFLSLPQKNDVSNDSSKQTTQERILISLFLRMSGERKDHQIRFYCSMLKTLVLFWPPSLGKMVIVLDKESKADHIFGSQIINQTLEHFSDYTFEVKYEQLPKDASVLDFPGRLKSPGYIRQLWSSFFIDLYTNDSIIAWLDTDSPFLFPVTMPTIISDDKVRVLGTDCTMNISWVKSWSQSTEKAIGFPQLVDFMTYFPVYIYRNTFTRCREHILKRFHTSNFEKAFKKLYHTGTGHISPVSVILSYAWYFEKDRYDWNIQICNDLNKYNYRLPEGHKIQPKHVKNVLTQPQTAYHGPLNADDFYAKAIPITFCLSQAAAGRKPKICEKHPASEINYLLNLFKSDTHSFRKHLPHPCTGNWRKMCLDILERHFRKIGAEIKTNSRTLEWENFKIVEALARETDVSCPAHPV